MAGGVARRCQDGDAFRDFEIAVEGLTLPFGCERPRRIGVGDVGVDVVDFGLLDEHRNVRPVEERVLAAVVEVKVTVDDGDHRVGGEAMVAQLVVERVNLWVVDLVNELVVDVDTGVEENRSIGMTYRVA